MYSTVPYILGYVVFQSPLAGRVIYLGVRGIVVARLALDCLAYLTIGGCARARLLKIEATRYVGA